jgi:hypothetical protein
VRILFDACPATHDNDNAHEEKIRLCDIVVDESSRTDPDDDIVDGHVVLVGAGRS